MGVRLRCLVPLLVGCAPGEGAIFVTVSSTSAIENVDHFHLIVMNAGQTAEPIDLPLVGRPVVIPPARTFQLRFSKDRHGPVELIVDALDAGGRLLAHGHAAGDVEPSQESPVMVELVAEELVGDGGSLVDGGTPVDQAMPDVLPPSLTWSTVPSGTPFPLYSVTTTPEGFLCVEGALVSLYSFAKGPWMHGDTVLSRIRWSSTMGAYGMSLGMNGYSLFLAMPDSESCASWREYVVGFGPFPPPGVTFSSVWGSGLNDIYFVGDEIDHSTSAAGPWIKEVSGTTSFLTDVWGSGGQDVYAVGENGAIVRATGGGAWLGQTSGVRSGLRAIWGSSGLDVYVVGDAGVILHSANSGLSWDQQSSGTMNHLNGVWGSGPADVFAVGETGTILHSVDHGTTWMIEESGTTNTLNAISGTGPRDVYVVGAKGTILHGQ